MDRRTKLVPEKFLVLCLLATTTLAAKMIGDLTPDDDNGKLHRFNNCPNIDYLIKRINLVPLELRAH